LSVSTKSVIESRRRWRRCIGMAKVVTDDLVIRAYWPLQESGEGRTSYTIHCFAVASGFLCVAFAYALLGSPLDSQLGSKDGVVNLFAGSAALFLVAIGLAYWFDGTALIANRDRIVLTKWLRRPRVVAVTDLRRIALCSTDNKWSMRFHIPQPAILFFNGEGRCVMSLYGRFRDEDLATLWAIIGIKPEGSWSTYVSRFDLKRRFPGAF
jgi:hypothetical protein